MRRRTVVEESLFEAEWAIIASKVERSDEYWEAIVWTLAHSPESGVGTSHPHVFALPLSPPGIVVYYTFNADTVNLISVLFAAL